jgi:hypothetical protein
MLSPLPYHVAATRFFSEQHGVWKFFADKTHKKEQLQEFKGDLLKNTYKFDYTTEAALYEKVVLAKQKLGLEFPVTIYQAQYSEDVNATIVYLDNEAHIVFSGKLLQMLSEMELLAILAHELSHVQLYNQIDGKLETTDRIINAIANHQGSTPAHYETARLFRLYTEVFCDRGAYVVTGDYVPIISALVKIATGLQTINADSYIKQAEEIFAVDINTRAIGVSHPENFIRARAIWLWHNKGSEAESEISQMVEGSTSLEELDLFKQQNLSTITHQVISVILRYPWMQTAQTLSLAKQYFENLPLDEVSNAAMISSKIENLHLSVQEYLAYILYDFSTVDKELEDVPLGLAFFLADELKLTRPFANAVKKERKLTDKKTAALKKQTLTEFQKQSLLIA